MIKQSLKFIIYKIIIYLSTIFIFNFQIVGISELFFKARPANFKIRLPDCTQTEKLS